MRIAMVVGALVALAFMSAGAQGTAPQRPRNALIDGIRRGDVSAVVAAEALGDRTFVPVLLSTLESDRIADPRFMAAAKHAIVALVDRRQLQEIWCNAADENDISPQVRELGLVGGWFGIRGLQELLKTERQANWERMMRRRPNSDVSYLPPRIAALMELADLVPNSPVSKEAAATAGSSASLLVAKWNDWIGLHKTELEKLSPTGEGVDYSERACKGGKPTKRQMPSPGTR